MIRKYPAEQSKLFFTDKSRILLIGFLQTFPQTRKLLDKSLTGSANRFNFHPISKKNNFRLPRVQVRFEFYLKMFAFGSRKVCINLISRILLLSVKKNNFDCSAEYFLITFFLQNFEVAV